MKGAQIELIGFVCVGALSTLVHVAAALLAHTRLGAEPAAANGIGFACAFFISYLGNGYWTFAGAADRHSLLRFLAASAAALALSRAIVWTVTEVAAYPFAAALTVIALVVPPAMFLASKLWVFAARRPSRRGFPR